MEVLKCEQTRLANSQYADKCFTLKHTTLTVIRSVLDGGDGCIRGGKLDKSRERFDFRRFAAGTGDIGRGSVAMFRMMSIFSQFLALIFLCKNHII